MEHLWSYTAVILAIVVLAKIVSSKTKTVDVLWLIIFGAIGVNIGILPHENKILEVIGEWGIVFVMFALGFEENIKNFIIGLKKSWGIAVIGAIFPFFAGYYTANLVGFDFNVSMIWGLTMTATAVSLTMVSLKEENLHKSTAATGIMTAAVVDDILSLIGLSILIPIMFVMLGTRLVFDMKILIDILPIAILLFVIVFILQVLSAAFAARYTGGYKWHESIMIGFGMLGRAELAFIVINIAYVQSKIINLEQFYILMVTVFLLNLTVPTIIKFWKPYYEGKKQLYFLGIKLSK